MEKNAKSKRGPSVLRAFGFILLPITLAYAGMLIWTLYNNANQTTLDPSWIIGLGLAPLQSAFPWSITGVLCVVLLFFALRRRFRFRFLMTLSIIYAAVMVYLFLGAATYSASIYY